MSMEIAGASATSAMHAMSGASAGMPPQQKMSNLFDSIDTSGSGNISQSQFTAAFDTKNPPAVFKNQGGDSIYAALDPSGSGSVSKADFVSKMSKLMVSLRAEPSAQAATAAAPPADTLQASLNSLNQMDPASVAASANPGALFDYSA